MGSNNLIARYAAPLLAGAICDCIGRNAYKKNIVVDASVYGKAVDGLRKMWSKDAIVLPMESRGMNAEVKAAIMEADFATVIGWIVDQASMERGDWHLYIIRSGDAVSRVYSVLRVNERQCACLCDVLRTGVSTRVLRLLGPLFVRRSVLENRTTIQRVAFSVWVRLNASLDTIFLLRYWVRGWRRLRGLGQVS